MTEASGHQDPSQGESKKGLIVALLLLVGVVGGAFAMLNAFSVKEGGECEGSAWGCAKGMLCVDEGETSRCRVECATDDDCGSERKCRRLLVIGAEREYRTCQP